MRPIFVFGSNLAGRHGAGSALHAAKHYGAERGVGSGPTGRAYAIPTKDRVLKSLPLRDIGHYVHLFLKYAASRPNVPFKVVKIGCGLAGYTDDEIGPMFINAPANCHLPDDWYRYHDAAEIADGH